MYQNALRQLVEQPRKLYFWTFILSALPLLHWFGMLLMALVTLRKGWKDGLQLAAIVMLANVILNIILVGNFDATSLHAYAQYANVLGVWLLAAVLYQTASWRNVLVLGTFLGIAIIVFVHLAQPNINGLWIKMLSQLGTSAQMVPSFLTKELSPDQVKSYVTYLSQIMTGLQVLITLVFTLTTLFVARYIQAGLYNPGGFKAEAYHWRLDYVSGGSMVLLLALAFLTRQAILIDCVPVLLLPGACVGLSLVHFFCARFKYPLAILLLFYVLLLVFFPQMLILITALGYLDIPINFRQRFLLKR